MVKAELSYKDTLFKSELLPHKELLYNFALKTTGNVDDAHDLLQETYMKAYRFIDKYEQGTNAKAWLFRIMKNSIINDYRKRARTPSQVEYEEVEEFIDLIRDRRADRNDLNTQIYDKMFSDEVLAAFDALNEGFRTIIILSDIEGLTYEEIAEILEIPLGTVRSRLHRARKVLQDILRPFAEDEGYIRKSKKRARTFNGEFSTEEFLTAA